MLTHPARGAGSRPQLKQLADCIEQGDATGAVRILEAELPTAREQLVNVAGPAFTMLMSAAALLPARPELCRLLLTSGARPSDVDENGYSALHWAAAVGSVDALAPLVEGGADANQRSRANGETSRAVLSCHFAAVGDTPSPNRLKH